MQQGVFYLHEDEWAMIDLLLADWWNHQIIDLRERNMIVEYLETSSNQKLPRPVFLHLMLSLSLLVGMTR